MTMDQNNATNQSQPATAGKPYKYTMGWLGLHTLFALAMAGILSIAASGVDSLSASRAGAKLLSAASRSMITESTLYSFAVIAISTVSLMLIEVAFRKRINYLQYGLVGCALCLFYLLLLSLSELMPFAAAYTIVSLMTVGLIGWFVNGLTANRKAVATAVGILVLFALIALAMYFTLRLKLVDEELTLN